MASALARTAMRAAATRRPIAPMTNPRRFVSGGDPEKIAEEMVKWKRVSWMMLAGCALGTVVTFLTEEHHHVKHSDPHPDYQMIRTRPFPWYCSDCAFLDRACFKKCKEERGGTVVPEPL